MKKLIAIVMLMFVVLAMGVPAFADSAASTTSTESVSSSGAMTGPEVNVKTGAENTVTVGLDSIITETSKATAMADKNNPGYQLTGVVAGGAIGVRRGIHRTGAGVIDLLTFWIPKKQPLVSPEKHPLE